jgi:hypothetical protein
MYETEYFMWVKVATMHFEGRAARWLQAVERSLGQVSWEEFCNLVHERFGREQHKSLIHQLFHIKQLGSLSDYVEQFASLVDELAAYESKTDPLYYTMCFVDGLKHEIKTVVMVQRPPNLDTACALALVQEEALDSTRCRCGEPISNRMAWPDAMSLVDGGCLEGTAVVTDKLPVDSCRMSSSADRVASLKSCRRARGLCDKCVEKWFPGHKCANTVQLHTIEEVFDLLNLDESSEVIQEPTEQLMMAISGTTWKGDQAATTIRLHGQIQQHELLVLVDSGSSHTFLNDRLQPLLTGVQPLAKPITVQVANGQAIVRHYHLPLANWSMAGLQFKADVKLLPLSTFDLVVGMDWLQRYSPMKVDWNNKWLLIPYQGTMVYLQGIQSTFPTSTIIELKLMSNLT